MKREAWQDSLHSPHQPLPRHLIEVPSVSASPATSLFFSFSSTSFFQSYLKYMVSRLQKSNDRLSPEQEMTVREYPLVCLRLSDIQSLKLGSVRICWRQSWNVSLSALGSNAVGERRGTSRDIGDVSPHLYDFRKSFARWVRMTKICCTCLQFQTLSLN